MIFILVDTLASGVIGLMAIGGTVSESLQILHEALEFIQQRVFFILFLFHKLILFLKIRLDHFHQMLIITQ